MWTCFDAPAAPPPAGTGSPPEPPPATDGGDRSCIIPFAQVGGNVCDFPPLVSVIFNDARLQRYTYSFYPDGHYEIDLSMTSAAACQDHCFRLASCAQFYYQYEHGMNAYTGSDYVHKCMLSSAFESSGCQVFFPESRGVRIPPWPTASGCSLPHRAHTAHDV